MTESTESLVKRYNEFQVALGEMKSSGRKRDKTMSMAEGFAHEIRRELEGRGVKVPEVA